MILKLKYLLAISALSLISNKLNAQDTVIYKPVLLAKSFDLQSYTQSCIDSMNNWSIGDSLPLFLDNECLDYELSEKYVSFHEYPSVRMQIIDQVKNLQILNYIANNYLFDKSCKTKKYVRQEYKYSIYNLVVDRLKKLGKTSN